MKKIFTIVALLAALLTSTTADAKYSDEYKAQHPSRVKTQKTITASGRAAIFTRYKLFSRWFGDGLLELTVSDCNDIKICTICYRVSGHSPREFVNFTWGDGENVHEIKLINSCTEVIGLNRFSDFIDAEADPKVLNAAKVISVYDSSFHSEPLIYESHKRWKEWKEAINAAEQLMNE